MQNPEDTAARRTPGFPDYEERLSARHAAFDDTFRAIVRSLPLETECRILDIGCGDGYFLNLFLEAYEGATVTGLDCSPAYLQLARTTCGQHPRLLLVRSHAERLPFASNAFDIAWSAHSMQSYDDAEAVLRQAYSVLKPEGTVAILENDHLHARLLPLPPHLEVALMKAEVDAAERHSALGLFYTRWSQQILERTGFTAPSLATLVLERQTPWDAPSQRFYEHLLEDTLNTARENLRGKLLAEAETLLCPDSPAYLGIRDHRFFAEFHTLFSARKPGIR